MSENNVTPETPEDAEVIDLDAVRQHAYEMAIERYLKLKADIDNAIAALDKIIPPLPDQMKLISAEQDVFGFARCAHLPQALRPHWEATGPAPVLCTVNGKPWFGRVPVRLVIP